MSALTGDKTVLICKHIHSLVAQTHKHDPTLLILTFSLACLDVFCYSLVQTCKQQHDALLHII